MPADEVRSLTAAQQWGQEMQGISDLICQVYRGHLSASGGSYGAWYSPNWGNLLSEYWEARAAAILAGVPFRGNRFPGETWLKYLPATAESDNSLKNVSALEELCNSCTAGMFPHDCNGKWTRIRKQIIVDTQSALKQYVAEQKLSLPHFGSNDVVVHVRYELEHGQVQWPAKSYFKELLPDNISKLTLLAGTRNATEWAEMTRLYKSLLGEVCGGCEIEQIDSSQFEDFAKMAQAPTVFCGGSTYCLWAAMGNPGDIYVPDNMAGGTRPSIDKTWHWVEGNRLPNSERKNVNASTNDEWKAYVMNWIQHN